MKKDRDEEGRSSVRKTVKKRRASSLFDHLLEEDEDTPPLRQSLFARAQAEQDPPSPRPSLFERTTIGKGQTQPRQTRPSRGAELAEPGPSSPPVKPLTMRRQKAALRQQSTTSPRPQPAAKPLFDLSEDDDDDLLPRRFSRRPVQRTDSDDRARNLPDNDEYDDKYDEYDEYERDERAYRREQQRQNKRIRSSLAREYAETRAALEKARLLAAQERCPFPMPFFLPPPRRAWYSQPAFLLLILVSSIVIIFALWPGGSGEQISRWLGPLTQSIQKVVSLPFVSSPPNPPGDYRLRGAPSITAEAIEDILASYSSPAVGTGEAWVKLGRKYEIDPAFALAFFIHESTAGTHPNWAGLKPDGTTTHNVGNIICAGYSHCYGRFRDYGSWEEGIEDWYRLIDVEYIRGRGTETLDDIIPIYAPSIENDVGGYVSTVKQLVDSWRNGILQGRGMSGGLRPDGCPVRSGHIVMTQGYGMGTHAPAHIWGAIDLALDGNGDGQADPDGSWGKPIHATHSGVARVQSNTWPAGNHVWIINESYKTGYAHLQEFAVVEGQVVQEGDLIGYIGSTGQSSGPHLDYQVWQKINGAWVNQNPLDFGAFP
jgi:hypothetical protein